MDDITEQVLSDYIFDGDQALKGYTFRDYLTIEQIELIVE